MQLRVLRLGFADFHRPSHVSSTSGTWQKIEARNGMQGLLMPLLERRTVWRDRSLSPTIERNQLGAEPALARYQNHSNRLGSFTYLLRPFIGAFYGSYALPSMLLLNVAGHLTQGLKLSENNSRSRHRYRERLDNSTELRRSASRMSPTSARIGSMESDNCCGDCLVHYGHSIDFLNLLACMAAVAYVPAKYSGHNFSYILSYILLFPLVTADKRLSGYSIAAKEVVSSRRYGGTMFLMASVTAQFCKFEHYFNSSCWGFGEAQKTELHRQIFFKTFCQKQIFCKQMNYGVLDFLTTSLCQFELIKLWGRELAKHYRERDRLTALERTRNGGIRVQDELNRSVNRVQPSEYDTEQMQSCHLQTESQLVTEEIGGKINNLNSWRIEDLLGGQSVLNADSIQNAQTWIANDTSLSPAQVVRARELLQELLITITTKPDMPIAEDRLTNFVADRRISDYNSDYSSRSFSHHSSTQSALRRDAVIRGREFPVMQNSLPGVPLAIPAHNWRDDPLPVYPDSREMPMSSRDIAKNPDFRCGSRSDYPILYPENAEFEKGNDTEHDPNLLPSEKRRLHYHDRRRISRSRSRSLGKDCDAAITERRVHIKSRDYVGVGTNHPQKGSGRNHICDEVCDLHYFIRSYGSAISRCLQVFESGGIVALPTDTLYGVVTMISNSDKLYKLKRRNRLKPLGLFVSNAREVQRWCYQTVESNHLRELLPGPVTLIFERSAGLPRTFNPEHRTVGIRIPDHDFVRSLMTRLDDVPLAQTSANISSVQNSPVSVEDFKDLWPELDLIIDDGVITRPDGTVNYDGSTVVNLSIPGAYSIIRDGCARTRTEEKLRDCGLIALSDGDYVQ
uniref:Threonylcarbamoyl-AMP synthase n=1 Tax=Setaria digitata TaxID=48799 RepID=A0A915Q3U3_9BILA